MGPVGEGGPEEVGGFCEAVRDPEQGGHRIRPIMANAEGADDIEVEDPDGELADELGEEEIDVERHEAEDGGEEDAEAKVKMAPMQPSKTERERHEVTHCPYRSWCPICVA